MPAASSQPHRRLESPLEQIERAVQDRAKAIALDLGGPDGEAQLRHLIDDEILRWQDDHKRGNRPHALVDPSTVAERAFRNIARYGPLTPLLDDDDVWEIMINSPGEIFVKRHHGLGGYHDEVFEDDDHVVRTLTKILDDSSTSHRKLDPTEGLQDAQLDTGARLHIVHGDLARGGHVMVNIRKFTGVAFTTLDQLVERNMMTADVARFLAACVRARASIVFAGAPGSGKTTMLSCCAGELDPSLRVVTAEEVFEMDIPVANVAAMQTRAPRADRPAIDLRRLVSGFLRMAPDVAIVGEVRDREALPLLLTLVSEAIDVVVHSERGPDGPRITSVVAVEDLIAGADASQFTITEVFHRRTVRDQIAATGSVPSRLSALFERAGLDMSDYLG
jgi:pilus assembly protein CpaF